ncbi:MAG TPA: hypothetical protein VF097_06990 [Actinomycetota bacterium]
MMRTRLMAVTVVALAAAVAAGMLAHAGEGAGTRRRPPAATDAAVPAVPRHLGAGEELFLVVGGVFPKRADALAAARPFGELQGYYVAPVAQFEGLAGHLGAAISDHVLVSAFRTEEGAREFVELATAAGEAALLTPLMTNRGFVYVGLGQEADPGGGGPLQRPLDEGSGS